MPGMGKNLHRMAPEKMYRETTRRVVAQVKAAQYLNALTQLGVAGVRIDAAKHINKWDLGNILQVCLLVSMLQMSVSTTAAPLCRLSEGP